MLYNTNTHITSFSVEDQDCSQHEGRLYPDINKWALPRTLLAGSGPSGVVQWTRLRRTRDTLRLGWSPPSRPQGTGSRRSKDGVRRVAQRGCTLSTGRRGSRKRSSILALPRRHPEGHPDGHPGRDFGPTQILRRRPKTRPRTMLSSVAPMTQSLRSACHRESVARRPAEAR